MANPSVWGSISELYPRKSETQKTSGNMCSRLFVDVLWSFLGFCSHLKKLFEYNGMFLPVYKASVWGSISELYPRKSETQKIPGNMCSRLFVDVL